MELCGPPQHAEVKAVAQLLEKYGNKFTFADAHVYGNDWICRDCQRALLAAGINRIVIHGR